jgi:hypothetical protein
MPSGPQAGGLECRHICEESHLGTKVKLALKAGSFYARWFPSLTLGKGQNPAAYAEFDELAEHLRDAERSSRKLARSTFYAMGRHQAKLEHKGALLGRIVDIGSELFAIAAACTYASTLARETPAQRDAIYELAGLFCTQARRRAQGLFSDLWSNDDAGQYKLAQSVLEGRYEFFEHDVVDPAGQGPMLGARALGAEPAISGSPGRRVAIVNRARRNATSSSPTRSDAGRPSSSLIARTRPLIVFSWTPSRCGSPGAAVLLEVHA